MPNCSTQTPMPSQAVAAFGPASGLTSGRALSSAARRELWSDAGCIDFLRGGFRCALWRALESAGPAGQGFDCSSNVAETGGNLQEKDAGQPREFIRQP